MSAAQSMRYAICSVALVAFCLFLWPRPASADDIVVTVNLTTYDITTTGPSSFNDISSTLEAQPWWHDSTLAQNLAVAVASALGYMNASSSQGPYFAYNASNPCSCSLYFTAYHYDSGGSTSFAFEPTSTTGITWATVVSSSVATPEPGTLSLLFVGLMGLGLLAGVKRYRGNRLQTQA